MTDSDYLYVFFLSSEEFADCFSLCSYRAGRGLLNEDITILTMLEGEEYEVDCFFKLHNESCHLWLCECNRKSAAYLLDPQWNDASS